MVKKEQVKKEQAKKPLTLKEKLKEQYKIKEANKKNARLERDVGILRSLLVYPDDGSIPTFQGIDNHAIRAELTQLYGTYRDTLKFLIISIIDIIHDAHGSRVGATTQVAQSPLFKLVVCNIFRIRLDLYEFIYTKVVPVTQSVLEKFIKGSVPVATSMTAEVYFTDISIAQGYPPPQPPPQPQPLTVTTILRDNVGIGTTLRQHIERLGFQIVFAKTPSIVLDSVSVPMTAQDYITLNANISPPTVHSVVNELFPGTVNIQVSTLVGGNYSANISYTPPAAPAPVFTLTFPWNPTSDPLVGYNPISCTTLPPSIVQNLTQITCLPPNNTKNCAFIIAYSNVGDKAVRVTLAEYITRANNALGIELSRIAQGILGFQPLTLEQYILCKLIGDYSYVLYYTRGMLNFVTTSDIISGLRLFLKGVAVLFSMGSQTIVCYNSMNFNAPLVVENLPRVINTIAQKKKVVKEKAEKNILNKVKGQINSPGKTTNIKPKIPVKAQILRNQKSSILRNIQRVDYGVVRTRQKGGQPESEPKLSLFDETVSAAVENPWFSKELSPLIKSVINPTISHENLELLIKVLKNQFKILKDQLDKFEKGGNFFMFSNSTAVNYWSSCTTIIKYLNAIFDIMSSEEFIAYFTTNCSGESYQECIKLMRQYVIVFPFIFDTETNSWYLNYTYPFNVCLNDYILSLLENKPKDQKNLNRIEEIIKFIRERKTSSSDSPSTPLEYGKKMSFNTAVTFVIMSECIKTGTQQQFFEQHKLYKQQSNLHLTKFDDNSLREFLKQLSPLIPKDTNGDTSDVEVTSDDTSKVEDTSDDTSEVEDTGDDKEYFKEIDNFFQNFVVDNNILYEDFVKELVRFLIQNNNIIQEGVFSVIKFILLFQNFDNIALCSYTVIKTIIEALLSQKYVNESFAFINNDFNILFYYNNLNIFFKYVPEVVKKIKDTRISEGLTSIDQLSILEENISFQIDLYGYCVDYALSKFYDELYDDSIDSGRTFQTTDDYVDFQMEKLQEFINKEVDKYLSYHEIEEEEKEKQHIDPLSLLVLTQKETQNLQPVAPVSGGKNNPKSKHNAKYRKKYKKFVSKYIIKKKKNKNKSTHSTNTMNKTKKNKRLAKTKPKSKYAKKTLKNKKRKSKSKSKSSNHKSKHNKKANTNYYNLYKHNKTLKH
jgi:hypothetical protein